MTPSAYAPCEIRLWPNATGMVALRSARGKSAPHPALRFPFSPLRGEKGKHRGLVRQVRETGAVCRGGGLSMVAVASGMVCRPDVRALALVMCAAIRRRAPALACGESRATTVAAARRVACADHAFRPMCLGVVVNYSTYAAGAGDPSPTGRTAQRAGRCCSARCH